MTEESTIVETISTISTSAIGNMKDTDARKLAAKAIMLLEKGKTSDYKTGRKDQPLLEYLDERAQRKPRRNRFAGDYRFDADARTRENDINLIGAYRRVKHAGGQTPLATPEKEFLSALHRSLQPDDGGHAIAIQEGMKEAEALIKLQQQQRAMRPVDKATLPDVAANVPGTQEITGFSPERKGPAVTQDIASAIRGQLEKSGVVLQDGEMAQLPPSKDIEKKMLHKEPIVRKQIIGLSYDNPTADVRILVSDQTQIVNLLSQGHNDEGLAKHGLLANLSRDEQKKAFAKLGFDKMDLDDRVMIYEDRSQLVFLKGKQAGNTFIFTESLAIAGDRKKDAPGLSEEEVAKRIQNGKFKPTDEKIELRMEEGKAIDREAVEKLKAKVTLYALAEQAKGIAVASNAKLPSSGTSEERTVIR